MNDGAKDITKLPPLPDSIKRHIGGKSFSVNDIGMSQGSVFMFDDMVLKTEPYSPHTDASAEIMRWLGGKLPVPEVIEYCVSENISYMLMSRIKGKMSCDGYYLERPGELIKMLAEAVRMLWSIDISDCPRIRDLDTELDEAEERVRNGLVDTGNCEPATFGKDGFRDPSALLEWLRENKPSPEPVFSHGDLCLPNIFLDEGKVSGFIDLGDCGVADKWRDISLCYRSLKHNSDGTYGGKIYPDIDPDKLFDALEIEPQPEKLRYYILLDELF